jgi:hypothetical protein
MVRVLVIPACPESLFSSPAAETFRLYMGKAGNKKKRTANQKRVDNVVKVPVNKKSAF